MVISTTIIPTVKTRKEFELQISKEWRVAYDGVQFVLSTKRRQVNDHKHLVTP